MIRTSGRGARVVVRRVGRRGGELLGSLWVGRGPRAGSRLCGGWGGLGRS
jgi:hypothetical protein